MAQPDALEGVHGQLAALQRRASLVVFPGSPDLLQQAAQASIDEAVARIEMYVEEGADILFLDSPQDDAEIGRGIAAAKGRPSFVVLSPGAPRARTRSNTDRAAAVALAKGIVSGIDKYKAVDLLVCPPSVYLALAVSALVVLAVRYVRDQRIGAVL